MGKFWFVFFNHLVILISYVALHVVQVSVHLDSVVGDCQEMKTVCPFAAMGCKETKVTKSLLIASILIKSNASCKVEQQSHKWGQWYILHGSTVVVISVSVTWATRSIYFPFRWLTMHPRVLSVRIMTCTRIRNTERHSLLFMVKIFWLHFVEILEEKHATTN